MKYKKKITCWTWDRPVERIKRELGLTLYKDPQYDDRDRTTYPRYCYEVTFKLIKIKKLK